MIPSLKSPVVVEEVEVDVVEVVLVVVEVVVDVVEEVVVGPPIVVVLEVEVEVELEVLVLVEVLVEVDVLVLEVEVLVDVEVLVLVEVDVLVLVEVEVVVAPALNGPNATAPIAQLCKAAISVQAVVTAPAVHLCMLSPNAPVPKAPVLLILCLRGLMGFIDVSAVETLATT